MSSSPSSPSANLLVDKRLPEDFIETGNFKETQASSSALPEPVEKEAIASMDSEDPTGSSSPTLASREVAKEDPKTIHLRSKNAALQAQLDSINFKKKEILGQLRNKNASETVKAHIRLLHHYNEIRDIGSGLLGMIADNRGVRVGEVFEEFGVAGKD